MGLRMLDGPHLLAPAGSAGNLNPGNAVPVTPGAGSYVVQFVVESVAGSPTVTFKAQSTLDGTNWVDVAYVTDSSDSLSQSTLTVVAVGVTRLFTLRPAKSFRIVVSGINNVTYRAELYQVG